MEGPKKETARAVIGSAGGREERNIARGISVVSIAELRRKVKSRAAKGGIKSAEVNAEW